MFLPHCLPVLIGSLPLTDHHQALRLIYEHTPDIPLWPQLPKNPKEGMLRQFLDGLPGLIDHGPTPYLETESADFPSHMAAFYEDYFDSVAAALLPERCRFSLDPDSARGFFVLQEQLAKASPLPKTAKGQITGPITIGIGIRDQKGKSILHDANLLDILTKMLSLKARWQVEQLKPYCQSIPPLIFIDEPGMVNYGSAGFSGVSEALVSKAVAEVIEAIHQAGGLAGIHICANGDWTSALTSDADIISFDASSYFDNFILYKQPLVSFLARRGILAWGIIPTGDPVSVAEATLADLHNRWLDQLRKMSSLGIEDEQLVDQTLIAPACGTGSLSLELAEKVLSLTSSLSRTIREKQSY